MRALMDSGADPSIANKDGKRPIDLVRSTKIGAMLQTIRMRACMCVCVCVCLCVLIVRTDEQIDHWFATHPLILAPIVTDGAQRLTTGFYRRWSWSTTRTFPAPPPPTRTSWPSCCNLCEQLKSRGVSLVAGREVRAYWSTLV